MMGVMETEMDWVRLGRALAAARGQRSQPWVVRELGISLATVQNIEGGKIYKKVLANHREYARLVGWTDDSVDRVLAGGDPVMRGSERPSDEAPTGPVSAPDLSLDVRNALQEGPLLDSRVLTVHTPGGELRATIVVRGEPDATPEELHQALLAWRDRREVALRGLGEADGDVAELTEPPVS